MSMYRGTGTEPLGSDPKAKSGSVTASPTDAGKAAGGTENKRANPQTKRAAFNETPRAKAAKLPGVQSFVDNKV